MKNCGRRFHIQVANKDFLNDMVKVIGPKYDPPQVVQEKVLSLIQVIFLLTHSNKKANCHVTKLKIRGSNEDNSKIIFLISQLKHML